MDGDEEITHYFDVATRLEECLQEADGDAEKARRLYDRRVREESALKCALEFMLKMAVDRLK